MLPLLFRPASREDENFLYELYASVRQQEVMSWGWPIEQQKSFLHMQWLAQQSSQSAQFPSATLMIVILDQNPIGQYKVDYTSTNLHLIDISILPLYHNKGIGTSILQYLQHESTLRSSSITLNVMQENPASRLYERLGFVYTDATDLYKAMKWLPLNNIPHGKGKTNE